jgi:hypothetical protein
LSYHLPLAYRAPLISLSVDGVHMYMYIYVHNTICNFVNKIIFYTSYICVHVYIYIYIYIFFFFFLNERMRQSKQEPSIISLACLLIRS